MKKTYMVFGLALASYDSEMLGLYAVKSFPTHEEAADWLAGEYEKGKIRAGIYSFNQCLILEQFELPDVPARPPSNISS